MLKIKPKTKDIDTMATRRKSSKKQTIDPRYKKWTNIPWSSK